jgi:type VI secretion system protein ImpE
MLGLEKPTDLRDLIWLPVTVTSINGGSVKGFIPTRYPGTESCDDNDCLMAKTIKWREIAPNYRIGTGLRTFMTNKDDYPATQTTLISCA